MAIRLYFEDGGQDVFHAEKKTAAICWEHTKRLSGAYEAACSSSWSIEHSYLFDSGNRWLYIWVLCVFLSANNMAAAAHMKASIIIALMIWVITQVAQWCTNAEAKMTFTGLCCNFDVRPIGIICRLRLPLNKI